MDALLAQRYRVDASVLETSGAALAHAYDERFERHVSLRILERRDASAKQLARLKREARILGARAHPALVRVLDLDLDHDPPYLVLEPLEGEWFPLRLGHRTLPSLDTWMSWMIQLAGAVSEIHEQGFLLRNIRPDEVFVTDDGLKLLGLAGLAASRSTAEALSVGDATLVSSDLVPRFVAPELLQGAPPDPRCDVYSIAALGFLMLTGEHAISFDGARGPAAAILKTVSDPPRSARALRDDVPEGIAWVLDRALAKAPGDRQDNADEFLRELRRASQESGSGRPGSARPERSTAGVGDQIGGDYTVFTRIGAGGMGAVLLAWDRRLERNVAIKMLHSARTRADCERLLDEARSMARVTHPNVVQIYNVGEHDDVPFIVMEYVPGSSLGQHMTGLAHLMSQERVVYIGDQVAAGVQAIHEAGMVHADIKPGNVLLGPAGRICVTDFGLVMPTRAMSANANVDLAGTPEYLAPERITGELAPALAGRVDVYALAVMAYELFTGSLPCTGGSARETMEAQLKHVPAPVTDLRTDLSEAIADVLARALEKDPRKRTPTCAALRKELLAAAEAKARPPERVLLADGDPRSRASMRTLLENAIPRARVTFAETGERALAALRDESFDLMLLDLALPDLNAVEVTASMRSELMSPPAVIVFGDEGSAADWQLLHSLGVRGFHLRPLDSDVLAASVRNVLGGSASR